MRITFDSEFDSGAWPGPLQGRDAAAGEAWVGPQGMLGLLETALGLSAPWEPGLVRAAALVPALAATEGFWSRSAALDPLGVSRRLLQWRDELRMHGWQGQATEGRLGALAQVTGGALPGGPDRWEGILAALKSRAAGIERLQLFEPLEALPRLIRDVFTRLGRGGCQISVAPPAMAAAAGDLGAAAKGDSFSAVGDGSLRLLRPYGPLQAAEDVAAWLASLRDLEGTVVVGADPVLDAAFRRFGLPTTGAEGSPGSNALLQILPLVLALGWKTPDPQRALELLALPQGPVPPSIGRRLIRALQQHPAVGSDSWNRALAEGLERVEDPEHREKVRLRLDGLFASGASRAEGYEAREINRRVGVLQQWMQGRLGVAADPAPWSAPLAQAATLTRLVQLAGLSHLPEALLHRFLEEAGRAAGGVAPFEAQVGLAALGRPGALAGPARRVIWWGFTRDRAPRISPLPLSQQERAALADAGMAPPLPGAEAIAIARRWRRPLQAASETLLLICPDRDAAGDAAHPHPLWDEIGASVPAGAERLVARAPVSIPVQRREPLEKHGPRLEWALPVGAVASREVESPSSMGILIGCSLAWTLQYTGRLRSGAAAALPQEERLAGTTVHEIMAMLLEDTSRTPDEAAEEAGRLFQVEGPRLAAPLFLPGADGARAKALRATREAARELFKLFCNDRFRVISVEKAYRREALGTALEGTPDLVVEGPDGSRFPVDLKWSGASYRRKSIEAGSAYQLAAYSHLVTEEGGPQDGAYFILTDQRLITSRNDVATGRTARGPSAAETWDAAAAAHTDRLSQLRQGTAIAAANVDGTEDLVGDGIREDGSLELAAPCRFCDYAALCGRTFGGQ